MEMRQPVAAGKLYENSFDKLHKQIENCFYAGSGPGDLPVRRSNRRVFGIVSPHSGYLYAGEAQAWVYKEIAESSFPATYIIIGTNHMQNNNFPIILDSWQTPFGIVNADKSFGLNLVEKHSSIALDASAFSSDISIEMQIPFLQFVNKDRLIDLKIIPLLVSSTDYKTCCDLAKVISGISGNICIIASSDFTHYGAKYSYIPFVHNKKTGIYALDRRAIDYIELLNADKFLEYVRRTKTNICGAGAIAVAIELVKILGAGSGRLLQYYTSADVLERDNVRNAYDNTIGFAGIVFE
jgi:MEMO1 family protein